MSQRRPTSAIFDPLRVLAVIAAALLVAGVAFEVGHATKKKDKVASASSPTTVKPGVLGSKVTSPDESTTTTVAATATTEATTQTTVAAGSQGQTTPTTKAPSPTTTTTRAPSRSCGTGEATAKATLTTRPTGDSAAGWNNSGQVDVTNSTDRSIQVDKLTVRLTYTDGSSDTLTPDGAIGAQLQASQIKSFPFNRTGAKQGSRADIIEFAMHPVGSGPECNSQPA
jgi:hypothetical protein